MRCWIEHVQAVKKILRNPFEWIGAFLTLTEGIHCVNFFLDFVVLRIC